MSRKCPTYKLAEGRRAELELELTQIHAAHMAQKPLLWVEADAHAVRKRPGTWPSAARTGELFTPPHVL